MSKGLFILIIDDFEILTFNQGEDLVKNILVAEAIRNGKFLNPDNVSNTHSPDDGIDIEIDNNENIKSSFLFPGPTIYQVKTGDYQKNKLETEFVNKKTKKIKKGIERIIQKNGNYVLCLINRTLNSQGKIEWKKEIKRILQDIVKKDIQIRIEILTPDNLITIIETCYPSLALELKNISAGVITLTRWKNQHEMKTYFVTTSSISEYIGTIKNSMVLDHFQHIRVIGEAGIGKSRLVLQALNEFSSLVVYYESPSKLDNNEVYNRIQFPDNNYTSIIVVDECDSHSCRKILDKIKDNNRLKLITIHNENDEEKLDVNYIQLFGLDEQNISEIIRSYGIEEYIAKSYARLCENSPRVAHCIGLNLKDNPKDLLKSPDTVDVWNRFIADKIDLDSTDFTDRKFVLEYLSLFKKFGIKDEFKKEIETIFQIIQDEDNSITKRKFYEIINTLQKRRILQGDHTLYISPKAFHLKLWYWFWEGHYQTFDFDRFFEHVSREENLLKWFLEMFEYANSSDPTKRTVERLIEKLQKQKSQVVLDHLPWLVKGNKEFSMKYIENYLRDKDIFKVNRRQILDSLQVITYSPKLFQRAATIILKFALSENESWANNSTNIFTELFFHYSNTEATLEQKYEFLESMIKSNDKNMLNIFIEACSKALRLNYLLFDPKARIGLEKTNVQVNDLKSQREYQTKVWDLLYRAIVIDPTKTEKILKILFDSSTQLINTSLKKKIFLFYDNIDLVKSQKRIALDTLQQIVDMDVLNHDEVEKIKRIQEKIIGTTYHEQLERFVGIHLLNDNSEEVEQELLNLAKYSVGHKSKFLEELQWLLTAELDNIYLFGLYLGNQDEEKTLLDPFLESQKKILKKSNFILFSGYLRGLIERNSILIDQFFEKVAKDAEVRPYLIRLFHLVDLTDSIVTRLIEFIKSNEIPVTDLYLLNNYFRLKNVSENVFNELIQYMSSFEDSSVIWIAIDLFYSYYIRGRRQAFSKELSFNLLINEAFFNESANHRIRVPDHSWIELGLKYLKLFSDDTNRLRKLSKKIISNLGNESSIVYLHSSALRVMESIAIINPDLVWEIIKDHLESPNRGWILFWLQGNSFSRNEGTKSIFLLFNPDKVMEWIDGDKINRAKIVARFIPNHPFSSDKVCPKLLLSKYGDIDDVKMEILNNLVSGWFDNAPKIITDLEHELKLEIDIKMKEYIEFYLNEMKRYESNMKNYQERESF